MKKITRKDFILLSTTLGLSSLVSPASLAYQLEDYGIKALDYNGPIKEELSTLLWKCSKNLINADQFVKTLEYKLQRYDLDDEFREWIDRGADRNNEGKILSKISLRRIYQIKLFFIPPKTSHPPHAHHDIMSTQILLKGSLHLRQYERVEKKKDKLLIKKTADKIIYPGDSILMNEWTDNVHWFGARRNSALILNISSTRVPGKTFNARGSRLSMRYHIDPTEGEVENNISWVPEISKSKGEGKYSGSRVSRFHDGLKVS